jgi:hypothetical protein
VARLLRLRHLGDREQCPGLALGDIQLQHDYPWTGSFSNTCTSSNSQFSFGAYQDFAGNVSW